MMPDGYKATSTILVSGVANDTLGENGQGLCRVIIALEHEYIGDLTIELIAPSGQSVTLIGPVGLFNATDFSSWNVAFTRCSTPAQPDPGHLATWSNNSPWGLSHDFTGTYYPFSGCFEQLTGPVNGAWKLSITDNSALDGGELIDFSLEFCDSTIVSGINCGANAGTLNQPDATICIGGSTNLSLPPSFIFPNTSYNHNFYTYGYIISQMPSDAILRYVPSPNLSNLPPGNYQVCGISYPRNGDTLLPAPNGLLTTAQLREQLAGSHPSFCGNITSNCVNVIVKEKPADVTVRDTICAPQCINFYGSLYCSSGIYTKTLNQNGCPYTAKLILTVIYPVTINIRDTVCVGQCSSKPGFINACMSGVYTRKLPAMASGQCDTTIRLTLLVVDPVVKILAPVTTLDCNRRSILLSLPTNSSPFQRMWKDHVTDATSSAATFTATHPGLYTISAQKKLGQFTCIGYDTILITEAPPIIPVSTVNDTIGCGDSTAVLQANVIWPGLNFHWTGPNGFTSTQQNPTVDTAGLYIVNVTNNVAGCMGTDTSVSTNITDSVFVHITAASDTLNCTQPNTTLFAHTNIPNALFSWDSLATPSNVQNPVITQPGVYSVVVTSPYHLCTTTASISIETDTVAPVITTVEIVQPIYYHSNGEINIEASGAPEPYTYVWKAYWTIIGDWEDIYNIPEGNYSCMVTAANGCQTLEYFTLTNRDENAGGGSVPNIAWLVRPNPSTGRFWLRTDAAVSLPTRISVYDGNGRLVRQQEVAEGEKEVELDLSDAPGGLYLLEIVNGLERLWRKIVVQR